MPIRPLDARRRPAGAAPSVALVLAVALALAVAAAGADPRNPPCRPTPPDAEGPFYKPGAPQRTSTGKGLSVSGRVLGMPDCRPIPGAVVEWWHASPSGEYDDAHRGSQAAGKDGRYAYTTDPPGIYPGRPPHIHVKAKAPGYALLTTQLYLKGTEKAVSFDLVLVPGR